MAIVNFPDKAIYPKQPKIFVYNNNTASSGTYYTSLNLTATRGKINKITLTASSGTAIYNSNLNIRVTIDGVVNTIGVPSANYSVGLQHDTSYPAYQSIDYFVDVLFYSSILIEFMHNNGGTANLQGNITYATE